MRRFDSAIVIGHMRSYSTVVELYGLNSVGCHLEPCLSIVNLRSNLGWAFQCVLTDPAYRFGNRLRGEELSPNAKRFIIEVYEKCTNRKLL